MKRKLICAGLLLWAVIGCRQPALPLPSPATSTVTATPQVGVAFATLPPPTLSLFQTTPTPLPPPTATPTATPIVYLVQSGDTIWTIAATSNRQVDEILAMNPGVKPAQLQIGQALLLPPPGTPQAVAERSTPVPIRVQVRSVSSYPTATGGLWLLGEVANEGEMPAQNIHITIDLLDQAGQVLAVAAAWVTPPIVPAAGKAPFGVLVNPAPPAFAQARVAVVSGETVMDTGSRYLDLAAMVTAATIGEGRVVLQGQVENSGSREASQVLLVASLYDAQGRLSGFQQLELGSPLPAGGRAPFQFHISPPGGQVVGYQVLAQGLGGS